MARPEELGVRDDELGEVIAKARGRSLGSGDVDDLDYAEPMSESDGS